MGLSREVLGLRQGTGSKVSPWGVAEQTETMPEKTSYAEGVMTTDAFHLFCFIACSKEI